MHCSPVLTFKALLAALLIGSPLSASAQATGSIESNFNYAPIAGGNYIWFNTHLTNITYSGDASSESVVVLHVKSIKVTFTSGGTNYTVTLPNSTLKLTQGLSSASGSYTDGEWKSSTPKSCRHYFVSGLMWKVPSSGLPGGINPVSMSMDLYSSNVGTIKKINWQWGAAVYTQAPSDPNELGSAVIESSEPMNYSSYLVAGARGGGGSNYAGGWSATKSVTDLPLLPALPVGALNMGKSVAVKGSSTDFGWTITRDL